ncbi:structural cement protein Gp24 [Alicyclobacillus suci]|uniref:structural cement protein Gp24 n=1 Tax=Alicyclobacillus suci TaxID=2816080 RepID=UPI001A8E6623|nr:hypothetical protein [Alicyclobacillus suci]
MANSGFFVIGKTLNLGYPGTVSRLADAIIENRPVRSTDTTPISFGAPVVLNSDNTYSAFGASSTAADFAGIAVREVVQGTNYLNSYTTGSYAPGHPCDVLQRGSCTVTCTEGTPQAGAPVYIVTVAGDGAVSEVGNFVATATPAGTGSTAVELTGVVWKTGALDSSNTAELTILSRPTA